MVALNITLALLVLTAGVLLAGATTVDAVVGCRRRSGARKILISLLAAFAAIVSSATVLFTLALYAGAGSKGSLALNGGRVAFVFMAVFLAVPIGALWGWALSVWTTREGTVGRSNPQRTIVIGLLSIVLFTCVSATLTLVTSLTLYGHDSTIAFPSICTVLVFLSVITGFSVRVSWIYRKRCIISPLSCIEKIYSSAVLVSIGTCIPLSTIYTPLYDSGKIGEQWGLLILLYPLYFIISLAVGGAALFFGSRIAARTWSCLIPM